MCVDCGVCGVGVLDKCYQPLTQYIYIYVVILGKYFLLSNKWSVKWTLIDSSDEFRK